MLVSVTTEHIAIATTFPYNSPVALAIGDGVIANHVAVYVKDQRFELPEIARENEEAFSPAKPTGNTMYQFKQIIDLYEDESHNLSGFIYNYKNRTVEELESIILEFQSLYAFGDMELNESELISFEDRTAFVHWETSTQTDFLAYLATKIAVARS